LLLNSENLFDLKNSLNERAVLDSPVVTRPYLRADPRSC
jgi:hypothetical protein